MARNVLLEPAPEPQTDREVLLEPGPEPQNAREVLLEPAPEPQSARKVPLEPGPEPQKAPKVSLEPTPEPQQARKIPLEPTAARCVRFLRSKSGFFCSSVVGINRARPVAADGSKWPLEPAPGPQMARNGRSSLPRSRRILDECRSSLPWSRRMLDASRACPEPQNARRVPLEPALEPQNARRGPLEPALEPPHARKVPLEPTAVRCVRFLRSKWPLEKYCPLFVFYRHHLLLGATLLRACYAQAHTSIYIYIYI
jgi:hypothetical protein